MKIPTSSKQNACSHRFFQRAKSRFDRYRKYITIPERIVSESQYREEISIETTEKNNSSINIEYNKEDNENMKIFSARKFLQLLIQKEMEILENTEIIKANEQNKCIQNVSTTKLPIHNETHMNQEFVIPFELSDKHESLIFSTKRMSQLQEDANFHRKRSASESNTTENYALANEKLINFPSRPSSTPLCDKSSNSDCSTRDQIKVSLPKKRFLKLVCICKLGHLLISD